MDVIEPYYLLNIKYFHILYLIDYVFVIKFHADWMYICKTRLNSHLSLLRIQLYEMDNVVSILNKFINRFLYNQIGCATRRGNVSRNSDCTPAIKICMIEISGPNHYIYFVRVENNNRKNKSFFYSGGNRFNSYNFGLKAR
jgi:hypothetical protein